jgi:D-3-phosphoglycerate dehydrogenase
MHPSNCRIVIPGDHPPQLQGSPHLQRLEAYGSVDLYKDLPQSDEEKVRRARGARCLINSRSSLKWPGAVLRQLPDLKVVSTCGIGTDAIDVAVAGELGIAVCNIPGRTAPVVAEHALGLMLAVAKRAWFQTNELKSGRWTGGNNLLLRGKLLGLIGAGSIAAETGRLAQAIGMRAQAWTFHPSVERSQRLGVPFVSFDELLRTSDVISVHLKLTPESRRLIGVREFARMRDGVHFINTARGAIVDRDALVAALQAGKVDGAGIDVFEVEPLPADDPLLGCTQVVLTPHNADQTPEGMEILNGGAVDNIIAFLEGRPQNLVTP